MQWCTQMGFATDDPRIPHQREGEHHARADARHNKVMYEFLATYRREWLAMLT
jgi:hypothetical protein